jgi:hypothetical protein
MKKILTTDRERIWRELASLSGQRLTLNLFQPKSAPQQIRIETIETAGAVKLVVLAKLAPFKPVEAPVIIIHPQHKKATLGFQADILKDTGGHLVVSFPSELFEIERRRFPRFDPERESSVSFVTHDGQRVRKAWVKDISLEGARIAGPFMLNKEDIIPNLTFSLRLPYSHMETVMNVSNAKVARIITLKTDDIEYGLYFRATGSDQEKLTDYLRMFEQFGSDTSFF